MGIIKGLGTSAYVGTRVALIVGAGLVAVTAAVAIKEKFTRVDDEVDEIEGTENIEETSES